MMLAEAVETAQAIIRKLDAGDVEMLHALDEIMKFDYDRGSGEKDFFQSIGASTMRDTCLC